MSFACKMLFNNYRITKQCLRSHELDASCAADIPRPGLVLEAHPVALCRQQAGRYAWYRTLPSTTWPLCMVSHSTVNNLAAMHGIALYRQQAGRYEPYYMWLRWNRTSSGIEHQKTDTRESRSDGNPWTDGTGLHRGIAVLNTHTAVIGRLSCNVLRFDRGSHLPVVQTPLM